jgi:hypothetical protein
MTLSGPHELVEGLRFESETIRGRDFLKHIEANGQRDPRFLARNPDGSGGVFKFSPFEDKEYTRIDETWYSLLRLNGLVVGIASLSFNPQKDKAVWLNTVSIDENIKGLRRSQSNEERSMRLTERLLQAVFEFMRKNNVFSLYIVDYTDEGERRLRHKIFQLAEEYQVRVHEM